jgi:hypothetical protein
MLDEIGSAGLIGGLYVQVSDSLKLSVWVSAPRAR